MKINDCLVDVSISCELSPAFFPSFSSDIQKSDIQDSVCYKTQLYQIEKCRPTKEPYEVSDPQSKSQVCLGRVDFHFESRMERKPMILGQKTNTCLNEFPPKWFTVKPLSVRLWFSAVAMH